MRGKVFAGLAGIWVSELRALFGGDGGWWRGGEQAAAAGVVTAVVVVAREGEYIVHTGRVVVPTRRVIVPTGGVVVPTDRVVVPTGKYVVPNGRVVVPTGRYVVPTGRVVVPTGRVVVSSGRKCDLEDSLYTTGDELEHPRELFLRHYKLWILVVGWSFIFAGKVFSIPTVLSWIDSISSDGFLPLILLVVVIMVTVIIVAVVLEIVVVVIVGVVIVVTGGVSSIFKFSFVIIGFLCRFVFYYQLHQPLGYGVSFDPRFLLGLSVFAIVAASASRAAAIPSKINCRIVA
nr:hypothetical protein [Tanacetum cinerariifolium]